jgi:hypothetical protein
MRIAAELCAGDLSSSHRFEEEIGAASSENRLFIPKMEFSEQAESQNHLGSLSWRSWLLGGSVRMRAVQKEPAAVVSPRLL